MLLFIFNSKEEALIDGPIHEDLNNIQDRMDEKSKNEFNQILDKYDVKSMKLDRSKYKELLKEIFGYYYST